MAGLIDKGKTELIGGGSIARLRSTRVSHATMSCTDMPGLQRIAQAIHLILGVDVDQNGVGVAQMVSRALHQLEHHQSDFDGFWQQQAGPDVERVVAPNPYKSLQNLVFEWMVQLPARLVDSPTAQLLAEALLLAPRGAAQQILKDKDRYIGPDLDFPHKIFPDHLSGEDRGSFLVKIRHAPSPR